MHIDVIPNRGSRPAYLLRESVRDGKKVRKRTLANLSALTDAQITAIRAVLRGDSLCPMETLFEALSSRPHGAVEAVHVAMQRLGIESLIASRPSRERDLVCALIAARVLAADSKLATTRWWHTTTLAEVFGVSEVDEDALYAAMDWLLEAQPRIEQKLAARHLKAGGLVLYDLSSSYFEGTHCALAKLGHNRDGKKGKLQVNYGLLTDGRGCPVSISVFPGNTGDSTTLLGQVERLRKSFALKELVIVGDRGMIAQKSIDALAEQSGVAWITALKSGQIQALVATDGLQLGLFDERNLVEFAHADYPGERLIACRNPELAKLRAAKRSSLLEATATELETVRRMVERGTLRGQDKIGVRIGRVINKYKVAKHFALNIEDRQFSFERLDAAIADEAALDGLYVIRTSVPKRALTSADAVRHYKSLSRVERAFRTLKSVDLKIRPIHHHLSDRVRAHIFLCMLAYYVEWHLIEAWRPMLFADEDQAAKATRDPVAPAQRSAAAAHKAATRRTTDDRPVHSFRTLLQDLATLTRVFCRTQPAGPNAPGFLMNTRPTPLQQRALDLAATITV